MNSRSIAIGLAAALVTSGTAMGHFIEVIPTTDRFGPEHAQLDFEIRFTHPMAMGPLMDMERPAAFTVVSEEGETDLLETLEQVDLEGVRGWSTSYVPSGPGNLVFSVEQTPYWEAADDKWITQYAKVIVDAYGWGDGWDELLGHPVEIEPMIRPYGIWTGNLFTGRVLQDGEPLPFAELEVEWRNDGSVELPHDAFATQAIVADANGVFHYAMPRGGWWGFVALVEADEQMDSPDGEPAPIEHGGVLWVHAQDMN